MKKTLRTHASLQGTGFIIISSVFFGTYGIWSKLMVHIFGDFTQAWTRGAMLLAILVPFGIITNRFTSIQKSDLIWFFIIGLCGGLNQAPYFYGFTYLPIGTATLLFYIALTLGTYGIGTVFFHEKLTPVKYLSLLFAIMGLGIIYRFTLSAHQIFPAIATMIAGLMGASGVVFSKKLSSNYSETQILTSYFIIMVLCNLFISSFIGEKIPNIHNHIAWFAQGGYAIAMLLANALVIAGFKYIEPSIGGVLGLLEVVFAAVYGVLFFKEVLSLQLILGSIVLILAAALPDIYSLFHHIRYRAILVKDK